MQLLSELRFSSFRHRWS